MRVFELLLIATSLAYLLWLSLGSGLANDPLRWLALLGGALLVIHLFAEGARWEMSPVYLLVLLLLASYPWCRARSFRIRLSLLALVWAMAILLIAPAAIAGGVLWPVFAFTPLTGPYPVGVESAHLIDSGRLDPYSPGGRAVRELMIEVWYPAESTAGFQRARYRDGITSGYRDSSLALVATRSFRGAPLAHLRSSYPVLIFSGPLSRFQNTFETEELASYGFIVVAIDHPYDSELVVFPDGRRVTASKAAGLLDFSSDAALRASRIRIEHRLAVRVADVLFVLGQLERWNAFDRSSPFYGRMDLAHTAMLGHSFGGAVTAEVCRIDRRIRAGVNMDGSIFGEAKANGVPKPFFFMFDDSPRPTTTDLNSATTPSQREARELAGDFADVDRSLNRFGGYFLQVPGLEHMNYSDYALHSQLKTWSGAGAIDVRRAHEMINRLTLAFLRRELLNDKNASVEAVVRDYPEANLRRQARLVN